MSDSGEITFSLPGAPPSLANQRLHWRAKKAVTDEWRTSAYYAAFAARVLAREPMSIVPDRRIHAGQRRRVVITMHRCRQLDTDNAYAAVKPILDGLKRQLIVDDAPQFCDLAVRQVRVRHKAEEHVEITVSVIDPDNVTAGREDLGQRPEEATAQAGGRAPGAAAGPAGPVW